MKSLVIPLILILAVSAFCLVVFDFSELILRYRHVAKPISSAPVYVPQQFETRSDLEDVDVLIVGGSSTREFFPHEDALDELLLKVCGEKIRGFNAGSSSQSLEDSFAIVEYWSEKFGPPKLIVFGMTLRRFYENIDGRTVAPSLGIPISKTTIASRPFPARHFANTLDRFNRVGRLAPLVSLGKWQLDQSHPIENRHRYQPPGVPIGAIRSRALALADKLRETNSEVLEKNSARIRNALNTATRNKSEILFLFTPISPSAYPAYETIIEEQTNFDLLAGIGAVETRFKVPYLTESDFYDEQHLFFRSQVTFWSTAEGMKLARKSLCGPVRKQSQ